MPVSSTATTTRRLPCEYSHASSALILDKYHCSPKSGSLGVKAEIKDVGTNRPSVRRHVVRDRNMQQVYQSGIRVFRYSRIGTLGTGTNERKRGAPTRFFGTA